MRNGLWSSFTIKLKTAVVCAKLAINAKKFLKHSWPAIQIPRDPGSVPAQDGQFLCAVLFNRNGKRFRTVFQRPRLLIMTNNTVHVAPANSHDRCAARLTLQRRKSKCFLDTWMNEKVGCAIQTGQFRGALAICNPVDAASATVAL